MLEQTGKSGASVLTFPHSCNQRNHRFLVDREDAHLKMSFCSSLKKERVNRELTSIHCIVQMTLNF